MPKDDESRKIAKDDVIRFILKEIMKEKKKVDSQKDLLELVKKRLSKAEKSSVSPQRLRLIAVGTPRIKVSAQTRGGKEPKNCPVCFHTLKKRKMKNLKGRNVVYGYDCSKCGFEAQGKSGAPRKYSFRYQ